MRVADSVMVRQVVQNIHHSRRQLSEAQGQLASGRRFMRPSQEPRAAARALVLRNNLEVLARYLGNAEASAYRLNVVEAAVATLNELLQDALELATAAGTGALTPEDSAILAAEADQLTQAALDLANTSWTGRYLFAGHLSNTTPFQREEGPDGYTFAYHGDQGEVTREVAPGQTVALNLPGDAVFMFPLEALEQLRRGLAAADAEAVSGASTALKAALDQSLQHRAALGVRVAHLELSAERLQDMNYFYQVALSREEDVDFALAASALYTREIAYQSSLAIAARLLQPSLLDYLR